MRNVYLTRVTNFIFILLVIFSTTLNGQVCSGNYEHVVINEISGDAGQSDGCNDAFVELAGPAGTDIGCMVLSNADWAVVIPSGTQMPADGVFVIACSEESNANCGAGINGNKNGLTCEECDFPNLPIDLDLCDGANASFYDRGTSGFTLGNESDTDGDAIVLFQPDGTVHDAVKWADGANGLNDNCTLQTTAYTLGDNDGNGTINDSPQSIAGGQCDGDDATGVPILPIGNCMLDTFTMPILSDPVYIDLSDNATGCNSSYIRLDMSTGASNGNPSHQTPDGTAFDVNDLIPSACNTISAANQWAYTDHPNPGQINDTIAWAIFMDDKICGSDLITITLEIYNWQHVSDNTDTYSGDDDLQIGSYIIPPESDPNRSLNADGVQTWTTYSRNDITGVTTLTYISGLLGTGNHPYTLQWDDFTNCCGSNSINSENECYEREVVSIDVIGPVSIDCGGGFAPNCVISCGANLPPPGVINANKYVIGGENLTFTLTDLAGTNPPVTNMTGIFQLPDDSDSGPYLITVVDGSGCGYGNVELNILDNCEEELDCPQDLSDVNSSADGAYCPGESIDLCLQGDGMPEGGLVCWYYDGDPNFDPYANEGTLVDCVTIPFGPQPPTSADITRTAISEVLYDASINDDNESCAGEFVELVGLPGTDVGCRMISDGDWVVVIPFGTLIPPDGFLLIGNANCIDGPAHKVNVDISTCNCSTGEMTLDNTGEFVGLFGPIGGLMDGVIFEENVNGDSNGPNGQILVPNNPAGCSNNNLTIPVVPDYDNLPANSRWTYVGSDVPDGESLAADPYYSNNFVPSNNILTSMGTPFGPSGGEYNEIADVEVPCLSVTLDESFCSTGPIYFTSAFIPAADDTDCPSSSFDSPISTINLNCLEVDLVPIAIDQCVTDGNTVELTINFVGGVAPYEFTYLVNNLAGGTTTTVNTSDNPYIISFAGPTNGETKVHLVSVADGAGIGCTGTVDSDEACINIRPEPTATIIGHTDITGCDGSGNGTLTFSFIGNGPFDFEYSVNSGSAIAVSGVNSPYILSTAVAGTYDILSVSDAVSCAGTVASNPQTISNPGMIPMVNSVTPPAAICNNGMSPINLNTEVNIDATPTGGNISWYVVSPEDAGFNPILHALNDPTTVSPTVTTTYFFIYQDVSTSCEAIGSAMISANSTVCCVTPTITCPADNFGLAAGCNVTVPTAATTFNVAPANDPALPTVTGGCGTITLTSMDAVVDVACTRTVTRTYRATDENNDFAECEQTFTITIDNGIPTFNESLPADATITCNMIPTAPTLTATDNCDASITVSYTELITPSMSCSQESVITRTWTATDDCGNSNVHTQTLTVEDNAAPMFNESLPADATITCNMIPTAPTLTATDNCDASITVSYAELITPSMSCSQESVIARTWTATDDCGNSNVHTQTLTVEDNDGPTFNESLPADVTISCDAVSIAATLTATDNCDMTVMVDFSEVSVVSPDCPQEETITRVWSVADDCGNTTTHTQVVTVEDATMPSFNEPTLPMDMTVSCDAVPIAVVLTAADNCDMTVMVEFAEVSTPSATCSQTEVITRTWTIEDACGNMIQHVQTLTVEDTDVPVFNESLPADMMVECDAVPTAAVLTATDNCDMDVPVQFTQNSVVSPTCPQESTITRVWSVADDCGNASSHTQVLTVQDNTMPFFNETLPIDVMVSCDVVPVAAVLTAADNCDTNVTVQFMENSVVSPGCPQEETITRVWSIVDDCGNTSSHTQVITVEDNTMPSFNESLPMDMTVDCDAIPAAVVLTAADNCDVTVMVQFAENSVPSTTCVIGETITRTWTIEDACGNMTQHVQVLTVVDQTAPSFNESLPQDITLDCNASIPTAATLTVTDACDASVISVQFNEQLMPSSICPQESVITRTWMATDVCGNIAQHTQTITIDDAIAPVMICPSPITMTLAEGECEAPISFAAITASDACGGVVVISQTDTTGLVAGDDFSIGTTTLIFEAEDVCGNVAVCSLEIHIIPFQSPPGPIVCQGGINVSLDANCEALMTADIFLTSGPYGCYDQFIVEVASGVFPNLTNIPTSPLITGDYVNQNLTVTVTDPTTGLSCSTAILVEDKIAPVLTCMDVALDCDSDTNPVPGPIVSGLSLPYEPTVDEPCGSVTLTYTDETIAGTCGDPFQLQIIRTWIATNVSGMSDTCTQTITIERAELSDISAPSHFDGLNEPAFYCTDFPANPDLIPDEEGFLTASRSCFDETLIFPIDLAAGASTTLSFTASDIPALASIVSVALNTMDNSNDLSYVLESPSGTIVNSTSANFTNAYDTENPSGTWMLTISNSGNAASISAANLVLNYQFNIRPMGSACSNILFTYSDTQFPICDGMYKILRLWQVLDWCNSSVIDEYPQILAVMDNKGPTISCPTSETFATDFDACTRDVLVPTIEMVDNCASDENLSFTVSSTSGTVVHLPSGGILVQGLAIGNHTITYLAQDACGNTAICDWPITIEDTTNPVVVCETSHNLSLQNTTPGLPTYLMAGTLDDGSMDVCGAVTFVARRFDNPICAGNDETSFDTIVPFYCCDVGTNVMVEFQATDIYGNSNTCMATVAVADPSGTACPGVLEIVTVSGDILTEENEGIEPTHIMAEGGGSLTTTSQLTDDEGYYEFELLIGDNYSITPDRNDDPLNGITTYDLIVMSEHILGIESLDSPYKMIAADINRSGQITGFDLVALRKMILFIDTVFTENTSWRFVDESFVFPNPMNPFASTFPEAININDLEDHQVANFVGIKIGDVNNSVVPNELLGVDSRDVVGEVKLKTNPQKLATNESYLIDFTMEELRQLRGYQFTLEFDPTMVEVLEVIPSKLVNLTSANFGLRYLDRGIVTTSWHPEQTVDWPDDRPIFSVQLKAKQDRVLADVLRLNANYMTSEAYTAHMELLDIVLAIENPNRVVGHDFELYQNLPNPFKETTTIGFYLPKADKATLTIFDVSGKAIHQIVQDYTEGYHQLVVDQSDLERFGLLYYRLETSTDSDTKRMIVLSKE